MSMPFYFYHTKIEMISVDIKFYNLKWVYFHQQSLKNWNELYWFDWPIFELNVVRFGICTFNRFITQNFVFQSCHHVHGPHQRGHQCDAKGWISMKIAIFKSIDIGVRSCAKQFNEQQKTCKLRDSGWFFSRLPPLIRKSSINIHRQQQRLCRPWNWATNDI